MKNIIILFCCLITCSVLSQDIYGQWKTIDDQTGEAKSIVDIYEENGKTFGKIVEVLNPNDRDALCNKCEGAEKDTPVLGLVIIKNMIKDGKYYKKGTIFDPQDGKTYKCRLALDEDPNVLQVRGYVSFLYATQYWVREN
ncbi:DUF2147 domain-containing protein [Ichthyenterobacterium magnum]|nr:DUF2147 domain-containing protein [Ichthyenterobacterium magnum]